MIFRRVGAFRNASRAAGGVPAPFHHGGFVLGEHRLNEHRRSGLIIRPYTLHRSGVELFYGHIRRKHQLFPYKLTVNGIAEECKGQWAVLVDFTFFYIKDRPFASHYV